MQPCGLAAFRPTQLGLDLMGKFRYTFVVILCYFYFIFVLPVAIYIYIFFFLFSFAFDVRCVCLLIGVRRICGHNIRNNRAKHAQGIIWE